MSETQINTLALRWHVVSNSLKFKLRKGLNLPITGGLDSKRLGIITKKASEVAIIGTDYKGMKPTLQVKEGDRVQPGQVLFSCKKNIGLMFTSRFAGTVKEINRGDKRAFQSLVLNVETGGNPVQFKNFKKMSPESLSRDEVRDLLVESGEWTSLRERPFDKVAQVNGSAESLFVTVTDTNPLAPSPQLAIEKWKEEFQVGLKVLSKLPEKKTYVCFSKDFQVDVPSGCQVAEFNGPHPAGNVGTHIHFLQPINLKRRCWHVGYQDVIAIGHLFMTGQLMQDKLVALVGPHVKEPKMLEVYRGSNITEVTKGEVKEGSTRVVSGSVLNGRTADGPFDYLGHYHNQISALEEDNNREFLGWQSPGFNKFSTKRIYLSKLMPGKLFNLGTSTHGSKRAMVPIGMFENVMPLDILPTQLLRALVSNDIESAQELGCLELSEEDLALCTFVSPGKVDFGPILRRNLETIEKEG
jgi:Na+-transporting NADH:ubiquinone oxidoreductase subunit A